MLDNTNTPEPDNSFVDETMGQRVKRSVRSRSGKNEPATVSATGAMSPVETSTENTPSPQGAAALTPAVAEKPTRSRSRRTATAVTLTSETAGTSTDTVGAVSERTAISKPKHTHTRRRISATDTSVEVDRSDNPVESAAERGFATVLAEVKPGRSRRVHKLDSTEREAVLSDLVHAIADSPADNVIADGDDDELGPSRRRRRRGGRRHRKNVTDGVAESTTTSLITDSDGSGESDSANTENMEPDEEGGSRRRRRRRRRRGEDLGGAEDDPNEVVVKVREPRPKSSGLAIDEVLGIEGSTRLEAKRQRRKEGRASGRRAPILTEAEFLARRESVDRKMIIRQHDVYNQIAVLEDGILVEHYVDRDSSSSLIGNIYLGKVQNVLPSMEAVFVDIGRARNAVLYAGEVDWELFGEQGADRKMEDIFNPGQAVLVQVSKDPIGAKGARLTAHISLPGRYVVYAPAGHLSGVSRKLPDNERNRLKRILGEVVPDGASVVIRTAAEGASQDELVHDVERLHAQWEVIERKVSTGQAPQLLYAEPDLTLRIVRDLFTEDFSQLVIAGNGGSEDAYDSVTAYVAHVAPHLQDRLMRWNIGTTGDPFLKYRVDEQISKALERKVFLPSGGSLIIDRTEAMTVIDVNTGRFTGSGGNLEETVTRNNLEAAEEIVRQLRLRDLGGIVVVDFIDMVLPSNRELLLRRLVECLGRDRTRHQVSEVTSLGLVQLTRKRIGIGLAEAFTELCEQCGGRGYIRHDEPVATQTLADGGERTKHNGKHK
jgi:ribonuclease E